MTSDERVAGPRISTVFWKTIALPLQPPRPARGRDRRRRVPPLLRRARRGHRPAGGRLQATRSISSMSSGRSGFFVEDDLNGWVKDKLFVAQTMNLVYFYLHFPLIIVFGIWLYYFRREKYTLTRDAFLASGAIALVIYWLYPVAPPRELPELAARFDPNAPSYVRGLHRHAPGAPGLRVRHAVDARVREPLRRDAEPALRLGFAVGVGDHLGVLAIRVADRRLRRAHRSVSTRMVVLDRGRGWRRAAGAPGVLDHTDGEPLLARRGRRGNRRADGRRGRVALQRWGYPTLTRSAAVTVCRAFGRFVPPEAPCRSCAAADD